MSGSRVLGFSVVLDVGAFDEGPQVERLRGFYGLGFLLQIPLVQLPRNRTLSLKRNPADADDARAALH